MCGTPVYLYVDMIYLQQTMKVTTATARNHMCTKTYGYRAYEVPRRRRLHMKAGYKHRDTTSACRQHMEERGTEAETRKRKHRVTDTQVIWYAAKESLSCQNTETQKEQEEESRLDAELTKTKNKKGRRGGGGA